MDEKAVEVLEAASGYWRLATGSWRFQYRTAGSHRLRERARRSWFPERATTFSFPFGT